MVLTIEHHGFHGPTKLRVMVGEPAGIESRENEYGEPIGEWALYRVSRRVARRLNRAVCGIPTCCCGSSVAWTEDGDEYYVAAPVGAKSVTIRDRYARI